MKRSLVFIFIAILGIFAMAQETLDFVPSSAGYFLLLRDTRGILDILKENTNFFYTYLADEGAGIESLMASTIEGILDSGVSGEKVFNQALSGEVLIAGESFSLNLEDLLTFDPFYLISTLKSDEMIFYIVWKCDEPEVLLEVISKLSNTSKIIQPGEKIGELRSDGGTLFYSIKDEYLLLGNNSESLKRALDAYDGKIERLVNVSEKAKELQEKSAQYWITGYFQSDKFDINFGLDLPFKTKDTILFARPEGHTLTATISQRTLFINPEDLDRLRSSIDGKEALEAPFFGDFIVTFPHDSVKTLRRELSHWFEMDLESYRELAELMGDIAIKSIGYVRVYGDLITEESSPVINLEFNIPEQMEKEKERLLEWGAERTEDNEIEIFKLENFFETLYFIFQPSKLVVTTLEPDKYFSRLKNGKILTKDPQYTFLKQLGMAEDLAEIFVNLGELFNYILGLNVDSAILYQETVDPFGTFIHTLRIY